MCAQGTLKFHVKWEGYDKKSDMTWEPEENLVYVQHRSLLNKKKKKRKNTGATDF